jgi:hypothetical protein
VPTRFKNASTVDSPQYPAAIAAGIRRGQEPAGIMAERGIAKGRKPELPKNRPRTSSTRVVTMHDARHRQRLEGRQQANRRRRCRSVLKGWVGRGTRCYRWLDLAGKAPPILVLRHRRLLINGPRGAAAFAWTAICTPSRSSVWQRFPLPPFPALPSPSGS